jgi:hypothetical protein
MGCRLHYIPLSMTYKEIYNIHSYFSGPSESTLKAANISVEEYNADRPKDDALRKIAMEGKKWKNSVARKVDMEGMSLPFFFSVLWRVDGA